jgi:DNA-binding transcriptional ArsR family regulator
MGKSRAEQELDEFEAVFSGLAHEARRRVLVVLMARGGRMTAGEIVRRFSCSWPTMTRHMQLLNTVGLISIEKVGRQRYYILNSEHMNRVVGSWLSWFAEETPYE